MRSQNFNKTLPLCVGVLVLSVIIGYTILAWTEPTLSPPDGNIAAPLNTGSIAQTKTGNLESSTQLKAPEVCIGPDCRTVWPGGITASSCPDPANQWVVGIGADGKVICQSANGGPPGATSPCSKSLVGNNKRIFITSSAYTGYQVKNVNLADTICQYHAKEIGKMSGIFKALMYYGDGTTRNPYDVLKAGNSFWNCGKIDATTYDWKPIASSPTKFFSKDSKGNYLENPIQYNEVGALTAVTVWTNFMPGDLGSWQGIPYYSDGTAGCTGVCHVRASWGWAETWCGNSSSKNVAWAYTLVSSEEGGTYCNWYYCNCCMDDSRAIYCVEQ